MKIAIPCENGEVMQHFGHATEFTVYTIEDIKPIEKETVTFDDTDHEKVAGGLKSRGVDLVICGNIGEVQMRRENIEYLFTEKYFYNPFSVSKKTLDIYHEAAHLDECGGKYLLSSLDGFYLNADISRALNSINNSLFILEGRKTEERERTVKGYVRLNSAVEYDFIENTEKYPQMENPQAVLEYVDMFF